MIGDGIESSGAGEPGWRAEHRKDIRGRSRELGSHFFTEEVVARPSTAV